MNSMEGNSMLKLDISFFTFYKNEDSPTCETQKRWERERERFIKINSPLWKCILWSDADLVFLPADGNSVAQHTGLPRDLNTILQKLLKRSDVHNLVFHGFPTVDGEGLRLLLPLGTTGGLLGRYCGRHNFKTEPPNRRSQRERKRRKTELRRPGKGVRDGAPNPNNPFTWDYHLTVDIASHPWWTIKIDGAGIVYFGRYPTVHLLLTMCKMNCCFLILRSVSCHVIQMDGSKPCNSIPCFSIHPLCTRIDLPSNTLSSGLRPKSS